MPFFKGFKRAFKSSADLESPANLRSPANLESSADFKSHAELKARPANFDSPNYRPCNMPRVYIDNKDINALSEVNSVFLIDDSTSTVMKRFVKSGHPLNWDVMASVAPQLFDIIARYDRNGACLYFMNHMSDLADEPGDDDEGLATTGYNHIQNPDYMMQLMMKARPGDMQGTPTGPRIKHITDAYLKRCADKSRPRPPPMNLIVWTDGQSDDDNYLRQVIVSICLRLKQLNMPEGQLGIQFFQVGNISGVSAALEKLDDNIKGSDGVDRDIVDTRKHDDITKDGEGFNALRLVELLLGSFVKQIDAMKKYSPNATTTVAEGDFTL